MLAQIGDGGFEPRHMPWVSKLDRADYPRRGGGELVVAHAGMGTVITAGEHGKPIVLLPRRAPLGEHNNDHQADTALWLAPGPDLLVADAEAALPALHRRGAGRAGGGRRHRRHAPGGFLARLRAFVEGEAGARPRAPRAGRRSRPRCAERVACQRGGGAALSRKIASSPSSPWHSVSRSRRPVGLSFRLMARELPDPAGRPQKPRARPSGRRCAPAPEPRGGGAAPGSNTAPAAGHGQDVGSPPEMR